MLPLLLVRSPHQMLVLTTYILILLDPCPPPMVVFTFLPVSTSLLDGTEAIPIADGSADTVARALVQTRVLRFGVSSTITTDRGGQFESHLWKAFTKLLGTKHTRTTSYHPIANGMVERFQLKSALKASPHPEHWTDMLHLALLGIRTTLKEDLKCTEAELVYGTGLAFLVSSLPHMPLQMQTQRVTSHS